MYGSDANLSKFDRNAFNFSVVSKFAIKNRILYKNYKNRLDLFLRQKLQDFNLTIKYNKSFR
jgi:hypothetical protein